MLPQFWLKRLFRSDRVDSDMISSGYPAARRCHSCVQVKDGEQRSTLNQPNAPARTVLLKRALRPLSHQRCLFAGVTTERWSCLTCGSWTCRPSAGPSCLLSCRSQRTSTALRSLRYAKDRWHLSLCPQSEGKSWSEVLKHCNLKTPDTSSSFRPGVCTSTAEWSTCLGIGEPAPCTKCGWWCPACWKCPGRNSWKPSLTWLSCPRFSCSSWDWHTRWSSGSSRRKHGRWRGGAREERQMPQTSWKQRNWRCPLILKQLRMPF